MEIVATPGEEEGEITTVDVEIEEEVDSGESDVEDKMPVVVRSGLDDFQILLTSLPICKASTTINF